VPLCKAQIDWSTVNLSPNLYGKGGSLDIAEATADLRKSMVRKSESLNPQTRSQVPGSPCLPKQEGQTVDKICQSRIYVSSHAKIHLSTYSSQQPCLHASPIQPNDDITERQYLDIQSIEEGTGGLGSSGR